MCNINNKSLENEFGSEVACTRSWTLKESVRSNRGNQYSFQTHRDKVCSHFQSLRERRGWHCHDSSDSQR